MAFNTKKFINTKFIPREDIVPVPDMKSFFDPDDKAVFKVRGLTGPELARAQDAVARYKDADMIMQSILSKVAEERISAIREVLGVTEDVPKEIVKRIEMLVVGSVEPKVTQDLAVKLANTFPIEFYNITTKIIELTGKGHVEGKSRPSGKTKNSKQ